MQEPSSSSECIHLHSSRTNGDLEVPSPNLVCISSSLLSRFQRNLTELMNSFASLKLKQTEVYGNCEWGGLLCEREASKQWRPFCHLRRYCHAQVMQFPCKYFSGVEGAGRRETGINGEGRAYNSLPSTRRARSIFLLIFFPRGSSRQWTLNSYDWHNP